MAQLTFPIVSAELIVNILVNLEASVLLPLRSRGSGPSPVPGKGLIDTGSNISAVALPILQQIGAPLIRPASTQVIGGHVPVDLYRISLHILGLQMPGVPWLSQASLLVMGLAPGFPFDPIIGMDILLTCKLIVDGPAQSFTLDF